MMAPGRCRLNRTGVQIVALAALAVLLPLAVASSRGADWRPLHLVTLLFILAAASEALTLEFRGVRMSGSFLAVAFAMALLGPAPAALIGAASVLTEGLVRRRPRCGVLWNSATYAGFALVGGWLVRLSGAPGGEDALGFAALVCLAFMVANVLNFASVAAYLQLTGVMTVRSAFRTIYHAMLPFEFATALLTAGVAFSYARIGAAAVAVLALIVLVFRHLDGVAVRAHNHGEELDVRMRELAAAQIGLLST